MSDELRKAALDALQRAEVEMRYAGWMYKQEDNIGRFDAYTSVLAMIANLTAALQQPAPDDARQRLLEIMRRNGLATGHGDTIDDALKELDWQLSELKGKSDGT